MPKIEYSRRLRRHQVVLRLNSDDAEAIGYALGFEDAASGELLAAAERCREADAHLSQPGVCPCERSL